MGGGGETLVQKSDIQYYHGEASNKHCNESHQVDEWSGRRTVVRVSRDRVSPLEPRVAQVVRAPWDDVM